MENKTSFVRKSNLTFQEYDYFKTAKVKNMLQALKLIDNECFPIDIRVDTDREGKKLLVFYFLKTEQYKELFDKWCRYEL